MKKALRFLDRNAETIILVIFGSVLCLSVTLQVTTRLLNHPFSWTEEVARFAYVWFSLPGIAFGIKADSQIRFELIIGKMHGRFRAFWEVILQLAVLAIWIFILYLCFDFIEFGHNRKAPALNVSMDILNYSIVLGSVCCVIRTLQKVIENLRAALKRPDGKET